MPYQSPVVTGPIADATSPVGDNAIVVNILDDSATHKSCGLPHDQVDGELSVLLTSLQHVTTPYGIHIPDMKDTVSLIDYKQLFVSKIRELTASSTSIIYIWY